jgi:DNA-binding transcriptional regulator of glucitol operon
MPGPWLLILSTVVVGWIFQLYLSYRQGVAFTTDARTLRAAGTVSIGVGGNRYRGGRAYVAIAFDDRGIVRDAISLSGWTTFARAKALPQIVGLRLNVLRGERDIDGVSSPQRKAARQAAEFVKRMDTEDRATQEVLG